MTVPKLTPLAMLARAEAIATKLEELEATVHSQLAKASSASNEIQVARMVASALHGQARALFSSVHITLGMMHFVEEEPDISDESKLVIADQLVVALTEQYNIAPEAIVDFFIETNSIVIVTIEGILEQANRKLSVGITKH